MNSLDNKTAEKKSSINIKKATERELDNEIARLKEAIRLTKFQIKDIEDEIKLRKDEKNKKKRLQIKARLNNRLLYMETMDLN